ncbi:hypothetical protein K432DRAFT_380962 [Lepidopterella palustris CBS 459.81]|uniref:DUF1279 domain-containing protein n=1 Tax=Lepidopterella palustris CBS 459.81 TaxID=1314670 RepID=A0A8E2JGJ5_9PEZI|nr:hypothetical protein K432DRAFT_380962 [Lepidopterella palustris CBS 459.81]
MKGVGATREPALIRSWLSRTTASPPTIPVWRSFFTSAQPTPHNTKASQTLLYRTTRLPPKNGWSIIPGNIRSPRFNSSKTPQNPKLNPTPHLGSPEPAPSLSQRLRKLSREYGWSAIGVYLALSALDFPFCFLAVRMLGTDRIGRYEHAVIEAFWEVVQVPFPNLGKQKETEEGQIAGEGAMQATAREGQMGWSGEVEKADAKNKGAEATIWTQLALAYAIHKSFIFIRVPLTAAVTPKVVKTLRGWGWDIGKRKPKSN